MTEQSLTSPTIFINVAVPLPLFSVFDYFPAKQAAIENHKIGSRVKVFFRNRPIVGIITGLTASSTLNPSKIQPIVELLDESPCFSAPLLQLLKWAADYYIHPLGDVLSTALPALLRAPNPKPDASVIFWHPMPDISAIKMAKNAHRLSELRKLIQQHPAGLPESTCIEIGFNRQQLRRLESKKAIYQTRKINLSYATKAAQATTNSLPLNKEQSLIVDDFRKHNDAFHPFLLEGITGSGKTETYIACIQQILDLGKQALLLVPEINLTPQTLQRFQTYFDEAIGILHSGMTQKARYETWSLTKAGVIRIVIGTRSAIFTEFENLGCILVDEEHDLSYKQQDGFRYSARNLAIKRAQIEDIPVLLGSATPSLESIYNVELQRYHYYQLTQRAGKASLPDVKLLDIRSRPLTSGISGLLLDAISTELEQGHQVLIFLNRRGYSPVLTCTECGWLANCHYCDARLTLHKKPPKLHCHHCDHRYTVPTVCPECKSTGLTVLGKGTEQIEEYLENQFPSLAVLRVDRDSTSKKASMDNIQKTIASGKPCILIGTQMLAKGHHFPNVTLVALVDPDAGLFSADFRALEHTAQQIIQVAGRAGRGEAKGKVIIQTRHADHPIMQAICQHNYAMIASALLQERRDTCLPPIYPAIVIRAESFSLDIAEQALNSVHTALKHPFRLKEGIQMDNQPLEVIGPYPAALQRKANLFRAQLLLIVRENNIRKKLCQILPQIISNKAYRQVRLSIDVDPSSTQ